MAARTKAVEEARRHGAECTRIAEENTWQMEETEVLAQMTRAACDAPGNDICKMTSVGPIAPQTSLVLTTL